jgi:hypothetical protein
MESKSGYISRCIIQPSIVLIKLLPSKVDLNFEMLNWMRLVPVLESFKCLKEILKCRKDLP